MYFNVGAEGCAHDSQVLAECHPESLLPPNTFILFDAGGPLIRHKVLTPYKGKGPRERHGILFTLTVSSIAGRDLMYHLRELRFDGSPLEQDQLFNLRYRMHRPYLKKFSRLFRPSFSGTVSREAVPLSVSEQVFRV